MFPGTLRAPTLSPAPNSCASTSPVPSPSGLPPVAPLGGSLSPSQYGGRASARSSMQLSIAPDGTVSTTGLDRLPGSQIAMAVHRNRLAAGVMRETRDAAAYVKGENALMEEILSEEHRMVNNADLGRVMGNVLTEREGVPVVSRILAAAKPPAQFGRRRLRIGVDDANAPSIIDSVDAAHHHRINTGKVNYAVLLEQQREMLDRNKAARRSYDALIADFVRAQQSLSERFTMI